MDKQQKKRAGGWIKTAGAVLFWILFWQIIVIVLDKKSGMSMGGNLLVSSPYETIKTLFTLVQTTEFWTAVGGSFQKIALGFFLAVAAGIFCAVTASVSAVVRALLSPLFRLIKAVPVASFIILALFWLSSSRNLSVLISFLMVLPVIYTNVLQGIESTDQELLEMAAVFRISYLRRLRYIFLPAVLPYFVSACSVGLGFCFKSGIAAEIIGLPQNSIGERLYEAKLYLLTEELFAWTAVIVLVSVIFEKAVMLLVKALAGALTGSLSGSWTAGLIEPEAESAENESAERNGNANTDKEEERTAGAVTIEENKAPDFIETLPENRETASSAYGLFDVTKRFEDKTVLEQFTLMIRPGETVALMGASGSGKSTAGKLLLGLIPADAGEVRRPDNFGAVFQEDRLCREFDAITNLAMVTGDRKMAEEALAEVGLTDVKGKPSAALSGGMKRRVAIVRALLSDGKVLVFDEPFTGLDAVSRQRVMQYVKEKTRGRSVLLITHNEEEAAYLADRTVRLM